MDSADPECRAIEIGGYVNLPSKDDEPFRLEFRAKYRAPDRYSMSLTAGDGSVIVFGADRQVLLYDPVRGVIAYETDVKVRCLLLQDGDDFKFDWNYSSSADKSPYVKCDVDSFISRSAQRRELMKDQNGIYHFTLTTPRENFLRAMVDISRPCPVTHIEVQSADMKQPDFAVSRIFLNEDVDDSELSFPTNVELQKLGEVVKSSNANSDFRKAFGVRIAVLHPEYRVHFSGVDWAQVRENDARFAKQLSDLLAR